MSGLIFPTYLLGKQFTPRKTPNFNTQPQKANSGKESRISYRAYPLYEWEASYEYLSDQFSQAMPRTNFIKFSQDFTQWTPAYGGAGFLPVVVGNWVGQAAPDGSYTADRLILNIGTGTTSGDFCEVYIPTTAPPFAATQFFTYSVWMKTNDGSTVVVSIGAGGTDANVSVTPNWQQFSVTTQGLVAAGGGGSSGASIMLLLGGSSTTSGGPGAPTIGLVGTSGAKYADLSVCAAQLEYGTLATGYIQTNGAGVRVSDLKSMFGFFSQMLGQGDTFLYQDPQFNSVTLQQFAIGNGTTTAFNLTATYQPGAEIAQSLFGTVLGPAGAPEWVQNTIGAPVLYTGRYGGPEQLSTGLRVNMALQSSMTSSWAATGGTISTGVIAPDGSTSVQFVENTSTSAHWVGLSQSGILTGNARYTFSVWLKYGSRQFVMLSLDDGVNGSVFCFDLVNGLASAPFREGTAYQSAADVTMTPFPNGWWRCSVSGQYASPSVRSAIVHTTSFGGAWYPSFTGTSAFTYMWGAQIEAGTQPTALIPVTTAHASNGGSDYSLTVLTQAGTSVWTFQQVQMTATPAPAAPLLWTGSFFYRCRFSDDKIDFEENVKGLWKLGKLPFESIIL
jgi:hypothetical protein